MCLAVSRLSTCFYARFVCPVTTTTDDPVASFSLKEISLLLDDAHTLGFRTANWIEPPPFVPQPSETDQEGYTRIADETDYRNDTKDRTAWYRYFTLGRYVVDGPTFDKIFDKSDVEPVQAHCLIWYQYMYHVDRKLDIPPNLKHGQQQRLWRILLSMHLVFSSLIRGKRHGPSFVKSTPLSANGLR